MEKCSLCLISKPTFFSKTKSKDASYVSPSIASRFEKVNLKCDIARRWAGLLPMLILISGFCLVTKMIPSLTLWDLRIVSVSIFKSVDIEVLRLSSDRFMFLIDEKQVFNLCV